MKNNFDIISIRNKEYINYDILKNFIKDIIKKKEKEFEELEAKKDTMKKIVFHIELQSILDEILTLSSILECLYTNNANCDYYIYYSKNNK